MTLKGHKKHGSTVKPTGGKFHRNEFAFIGAPCGAIQDLTQKLAAQLDGKKVGYVDAEHGNGEEASVFHRVYTDKISFHQLNFQEENIEFAFRRAFDSSDLVLVNGNHFLAQQQVVIINAKKKESLQKKLDRLTDVLFFILDEGETEIYDYLKVHNPAFSALPQIPISEVEQIAGLLAGKVQENRPPVKGLVLAGGKSLRMGTDKGQLNYHGKPQREYMAGLLSEVCPETFISVQDPKEESDFPFLPDSFLDLGPYGGILSAFRNDPNAAWLVVATDIPLLSLDHLQLLMEKRNPSKMATCFYNPETDFPEPLITLWEPRAYPQLLQFLAQGYSCPRKVLINSEIELVSVEDARFLANANTPEEMERLKSQLHG